MALSNLSGEPGSRSKTGPDCTVCAALDELPDEKATLLLDALKNPRWRYTDIMREVAADTTIPEWVRNIADGTYAKHASGRCWARTKLR